MNVPQIEIGKPIFNLNYPFLTNVRYFQLKVRTQYLANLLEGNDRKLLYASEIFNVNQVTALAPKVAEKIYILTETSHFICNQDMDIVFPRKMPCQCWVTFATTLWSLKTGRIHIMISILSLDEFVFHFL